MVHVPHELRKNIVNALVVPVDLKERLLMYGLALPDLSSRERAASFLMRQPTTKSERPNHSWTPPPGVEDDPPWEPPPWIHR